MSGETILGSAENPEVGDQTEEQDVSTEDQTEDQVEDKEEEESSDDKEGKSEDGKDAEEEGDKPQGAPDKYGDFELPEGYEITDKELFEEATGLFKELDLSQDEAQKLVDYEVKMREQASQQQWEVYQQQVTKWGEEAKTDEEYGGDDFEENMGKAALARDEFGSDAFIKMLDSTGMGNNPEMIRFLYHVGEALGDDDVEHGRGSAQDRPAPEHVMYPTMREAK